ncbi:MAG: hypothetical protein ACK4SO_05345, partial [Candidatus Kapaibacteriota bacterium]
NTKNFMNEYYQDISLAVEFNDMVRLGFGKSILQKYNYFDNQDYYFTFLKFNLTNYPLAIGFNVAFYTNEMLKLQNFVLGLHATLSLNFLRL